MSNKDDFLERINSIYIACGILFFFSIERLSTRRSCKRGNMYGIIAMIIAIISTLFLDEKYGYFFIAFFLGGVIGIISSICVNLTRLPQYIAIMHSLVGISAILIAFANFLSPSNKSIIYIDLILMTFQVFIGTLTFSGSFIAFLKFNHIMDKPLICLGCCRHIISFILLAVSISTGTLFILTQEIYYLISLSAFSLILGFNTVSFI